MFREHRSARGHVGARDDAARVSRAFDGRGCEPGRARARAGERDPPTANDDGDTGLTNRLGPEHEALTKAINAELIPLTEECIELATARGPAPRGMLAIDVSAIGDEDVGAVVESVEFPEANELHDPELLECVRESSLAMNLPPPPEGGRTSFTVTMRVDEQQ